MYLFSYKPEKYVNEPVSYPYIKIDSPVLSISTITRVSQTATVVTNVKHNYSNGYSVIISGAIQAEYNGTYTIAVVDDYTFTYTITGTPATPATGTILVRIAPSYPITLQQLYDHVRVDAPQEQLSYLNMILAAVTRVAEDYMNIDIIQKSWRTYRDDFNANYFQLRKSPFVSLQNFQILSNGVYVDIDPSLYYISQHPYYAQIALKNEKVWPVDSLDLANNAIKIEFTSGLATDSNNIPEDLQQALLNHAAFMYENRGNNDIAGLTSSGTSEETSGLNAIPNLSKLIYENYRVADIFGGYFYN